MMPWGKSIAGLVLLGLFQGCNSAPPTPPPGMVYVKAGAFKMGYADSDALPSEKANVKDVTVEKHFFLDTFEVTNQQFLDFCNLSNAKHPQHWEEKKLIVDGPEGTKVLKDEAKLLPVTNVTYTEAEAYAKWNRKRMPTEVEWEWAARGENSWLYPWGNEWAAGKANYFEENKKGPVNVGEYAAGKGPFGTLDQAGNVWEWTSTDDATAQNTKVIKGGSFTPLEKKPRASLSGRKAADQRANNLGFRCARDVEE